ncbi:hypothetical protein [Emticicia sp. TH156]|uniref:DUF7683 domain-containing protein n=1 Tax=Emticicia sp. TH156 TaxID=2067454 RepID=UPI000C771A4D|nr:hypothetical protein [Emticicia sp. TH156]PLK42104.1 hypothetical protein C0V77_22585 [Emticicia sp. TH156]
MEEVQRIIAYYNKESEDLVGEYPINLSLDILNTIFVPSPEDDIHLYFVYEIKENQATVLKKYTNIEFDFSNYSYFLECYNVSS